MTIVTTVTPALTPTLAMVAAEAYRFAQDRDATQPSLSWIGCYQYARWPDAKERRLYSYWDSYNVAGSLPTSEQMTQSVATSPMPTGASYNVIGSQPIPEQTTQSLAILPMA